MQGRAGYRRRSASCRGWGGQVWGCGPRDAHHHGLLHGQVWQQQVVLHDVTGHLAEGPQFPRLPIDQDLPFHPRLPAGTPSVRDGGQGHYRTSSVLPRVPLFLGSAPTPPQPYPYLYPAKRFMSVDLPDPEGPMMPIISRQQNLPDRHLRRVL